MGGDGIDFRRIEGSLRVLSEIPVASNSADADEDPFDAQRRAALMALFHGRGATAEQPMVFGWQRLPGSGTVEVLTSTPSIAPPGASLVPVSGLGDMLGLVGSWCELAIRPAGRSTSDPSGGAGDESTNGSAPQQAAGVVRAGRTTSMESTLLPVWHGPFWMLVTAIPVSHDELDGLVEQVGDSVEFARSRADHIAEFGPESERLAWWHRELLAGASRGLWWTRVLAGAQNAAEASALAGLVAASFSTAELGYELIPLTPGVDLNKMLHVPDPDRRGDRAANWGKQGFVAGSSLLGCLTRPPASEVPGVRMVLRSDFDTTPERAGSGGVLLGQVLDGQRQASGGFRLPLSSLNRHTFTPGATGSGKSETQRTLVSALAEAGVPTAVIEPAKAEWARGLSRRLPDRPIVRIAPGDAGQVACCIDPLRPVEGFTLQTHIDLVRSLFLAAFDADEPFPQVLSAALQQAYEEQGWDTLLSAPKSGLGDADLRYPTLSDVVSAANDVVERIGYGPEVHQNIQGFIKVRLQALRLGTTGRFLEGGHPIDLDALLRSTVVFEIEDVGDDAEKAFIIGAFLLKLTEHYRVQERRGAIPPDQLTHLTVIEEAHRLLRNPDGQGGAASKAVEMFASLLAEVRAYGEGVAIAEQIPSKIIPDAIKNSAVKIVHRLPAADDREAVGATMNLTDEQSEYLVTVAPGEAAVFCDGMDRPVLVRVPDPASRIADPHAEPVGPNDLVERSFGRCAATYPGGPIHLRALAAGRGVFDRTPALVWWVELATVAHLHGQPVPKPDALALQTLMDLDDETVHAGSVDAIDQAVAERSAVLAGDVSVAALAEHLYEDLSTMRTGRPIACSSALNPVYLCTDHRLALVARELDAHIGSHGQQHSCQQTRDRVEYWSRLLGVAVDGATCIEQRGTIAALWDALDVIDPESRQRIQLFGASSPSRLETVTGTARDTPRWNALAGQTLARLSDADWAADHYTAAGLERSGGNY